MVLTIRGERQGKVVMANPTADESVNEIRNSCALLVRDAHDFENAFQAIRDSRPESVQAIADLFLGGHLGAIVALMKEMRLPAMYRSVTDWRRAA